MGIFQEWWQEDYNLREETETAVTYLGYGANVQPTKQGCDDATFDETVSNF